MGLYTRVIVGTDGSSTADQAVRVAAGLAQADGSELLVVSAYRPTEEAELGPPSERAQMPGDAALSRGYRAAAELAQDAASEARDVAPGIGVEGSALDGEAAERLLELHEKDPDALLVVGSLGMTGSRRFLLGSVPNKISHHAPGDVLIVRTDRPRRPEVPRSILVGTDGSVTATRAVERAYALAAVTGARVDVLTAGGRAADAQRTLDDAQERAGVAGVQMTGRHLVADPAAALVDEGAAFDLVVVGSVGMSGASRFLLGSVPHKVSHHVTTDLLIVKTD